MQYPNDDMDELMRRAAEDYPLNTSSGNWNAVRKALESGTPPSESKKGSKGRFLWLLLLLPMTLLCNRYLVQNGSSSTASAPTQTGSPQGRTPAPSNTPPGQPSNRPAEMREESIANNSSSPSSSSSITSQPEQPVSGGQSPLQERQPSSANNHIANNQAPASRADQHIKSSSIPRKKTPVKNQLAQVNGLDEIDESSKISYEINESGTQKEQESLLTKEASVSSNDTYAAADSSLKTGEDPSSEKAAAQQPTTDSILLSTKTARPGRSKPKRFYAALMGGADLTTIHLQKVEKVGTDYGGLVGFELNRKWSVEAGVFSVKKEYYTDGKHFNTSKIYVPHNSEITEVEGNCRMIEIPLAVRYSFKPGRKGNWFATGGLSSYLMKSENYSYVYYYPLTGQYVERYRTYANSSQHWAASVQLSGGYQYQLGKIGAIRLEPYLKVPVRGLGIGSLPLLSTGLHVGISRKLF
jgi:hypothetical protein